MGKNNEIQNLFLIKSKKNENYSEPQKLVDYKSKSKMKNIIPLNQKKEIVKFEKIPAVDKKIMTLQNFKKEENLLFNLTKTETISEFFSTKYFSLSHRPFVKGIPQSTIRSKRKSSKPHKVNELVLEFKSKDRENQNLRENFRNHFIQKYMLYINNLFRTNSNSPQKNYKNPQNLPSSNFYVLNKKEENKFTLDHFREEMFAFKKFIDTTKNIDKLQQNANLILKNSNHHNFLKNEPIERNSSPDNYDNNKYLNKILLNVFRKICYVNNRNEKISEDHVVNLIKQEANEITKNLDSMFESTCKIKNFSHVISEKEETYFLPFINSIIERKYPVEINVSSLESEKSFRLMKSNPKNENSTQNIKQKIENYIINSDTTPLNSKESFNNTVNQKINILTNNPNPLYKFELTTINENTEDSKKLKSNLIKNIYDEQSFLPLEQKFKDDIETFNVNRIFSSRSRRFSSPEIKTIEPENRSPAENQEDQEFKKESSQNDCEIFKMIKESVNFDKHKMITPLKSNDNLLKWLKLKFEKTKVKKNLTQPASSRKENNTISEKKIIENLKKQTQEMNEVKDINSDSEKSILNKSKSLLEINRRNSMINKQIKEKMKRESYIKFKRFNSDRMIEFLNEEKLKKNSELSKETNKNILIKTEDNDHIEEKSENSNNVKENSMFDSGSDYKTLSEDRNSSSPNSANKLKNRNLKKKNSIIYSNQKESKKEEEEDEIKKLKQKFITSKKTFSINEKEKLKYKSDKTELPNTISEISNEKMFFNNKLSSDLKIQSKNFNNINSPTKLDSRLSLIESNKIQNQIMMNAKSSSTPFNTNKNLKLGSKNLIKSINYKTKSKVFASKELKNKINVDASGNKAQSNKILVENRENNSIIIDKQSNELNDSKYFEMNLNEENILESSLTKLKAEQNFNQNDNINSEQIIENLNPAVNLNSEVEAKENSILTKKRKNEGSKKEDNATNNSNITNNLISKDDSLNSNTSNFNDNSNDVILPLNILEKIKSKDKSRTVKLKKILKQSKLMNEEIEVDENEKPETHDRVKFLADLIDQNLSSQGTRKYVKKYTYSQ